MSGSTDNNSEKSITTRFLVFPLTYYFVELYFIKRHVWKVKMFHKTVHKNWNHFKLSKQSPKNSAKKFCFTIFDRLKVTFDQSSALFDQLNRNWVAIETSKDSRIFFFYHFDRSSQSFNQSKMLYFKFSLKSSKTWIFTLTTFIK